MVCLCLALVLEKHLRQTINSISMIKFNTEKIKCEKIHRWKRRSNAKIHT